MLIGGGTPYICIGKKIKFVNLQGYYIGSCRYLRFDRLSMFNKGRINL